VKYIEGLRRVSELRLEAGTFQTQGFLSEYKKLKINHNESLFQVVANIAGVTRLI
jgi:hypothetical protein